METCLEFPTGAVIFNNGLFLVQKFFCENGKWNDLDIMVKGVAPLVGSRNTRMLQ